MKRVVRCNKCGAPKRGHACGRPTRISPAQQQAMDHPLYPHLGGLVKRTWRAIMCETAIAGQTFHSIKHVLTPEKSGCLVGTLFELYFQRELESLGLGLGFYLPKTRGWGVAGNHLDVLHLGVPEWNIEIKTTSNRYVSQRPSSVKSMVGGYWLLSIRYNWVCGRNQISGRFGWVEKGDWCRDAGHGIRLSADVFWDTHISIF